LFFWFSIFVKPYLIHASVPFATAYTTLSNSIISQSGQIIVTFKPTTNLATLDKLVLKITAAASNYNDDTPDSNGFDSAQLPGDLLSGTGCLANACLSSDDISILAANLSSTAGIHTITITLNAGISNSMTYTFTLGHASNPIYRFLNPSSTISTTYPIRLYSQNAAQTVIYDDTIMKVNPVNGVLVSADVELALSYSISAIGTATTVPSCGNANFVTTSASTATTIPFGFIYNPDTQFYNVAQTHTVTTNVANGYVLTVKYNHPLKLKAGGATIPNTICGNTQCTTSAPKTWTDYAGYNGFGYSVGNVSGADRAADFTADELYKPFSASAVIVATKSSPASASQIATCYRLSVDAAQQTGYYSDVLTYVATPKF